MRAKGREGGNFLGEGLRGKGIFCNFGGYEGIYDGEENGCLGIGG